MQNRTGKLNMRVARLTTLPDCDFCKMESPLSRPLIAKCDAPTSFGWAYLCFYHYRMYALNQGTKLEKEDKSEKGAAAKEIISRRQALVEEGE